MNLKLVLAIIIGLAFFLFFFLVLPEYQAIKIAREAINERETVLAERAKLFDNFSRLNQQYNERQSDIDRMSFFLPRDKQLDQIISSIQALTVGTGVQMQSLSVIPQARGQASYQKVNVIFEVIGSYLNLPVLLGEIERSLRLYDVNEVTITKDNQSGSSIVLRFSLKLDAYYLGSASK